LIILSLSIHHVAEQGHYLPYLVVRFGENLFLPGTLCGDRALHGLHGAAAVAIQPVQIRIVPFTEILLVLLDPLFIPAHIAKGIGKNTAAPAHAYLLSVHSLLPGRTNPF
jgi:hypothetical protein